MPSFTVIGSDSFGWFILGFVIIVIIVIAVMLAGVNRSSCQWESDAGRLIFRPTGLERLGINLMALLFATVPMILTFACLREARLNPALAPLDYAMVALWLLMIGGLVLTLLWRGAATELVIDMEKRTYYHTRRWFLGEQVRGGSLEEMSGVCLAGEGLSSVMLLFRNRPSMPYGYILASYTKRAKAQVEMENLAQSLSLPIVAGPWAHAGPNL